MPAYRKHNALQVHCAASHKPARQSNAAKCHVPCAQCIRTQPSAMLRVPDAACEMCRACGRIWLSPSISFAFYLPVHQCNLIKCASVVRFIHWPYVRPPFDPAGKFTGLQHTASIPSPTFLSHETNFLYENVACTRLYSSPASARH